MTVLLDTSVLVGLEQERVSADAVPGRASICVITLEELWLGVLRAVPARRPTRRATYERAAAVFLALPIDEEVARACADIRGDGRRRGQRYQLGDSLIGATARVHGLSLLTQDPGMLGMLGVDVRVV